MFGSQIGFAKHINRSRQYVGKLKKQGKLVMRGKKVDFKKSLKMLAELADPSKDPSEIMPRADGRVDKSVGMKAAEAIKAEGMVEPIPTDAEENPAETELSTETEPSMGPNPSAIQYQTSRAAKEDFTARLKKVEYEKAIGELVHREGVTVASFQVGRMLRDKLLALPGRLAPRVTIESDQKNNYVLLMSEIENVLNQVQQSLSEYRTQLSR